MKLLKYWIAKYLLSRLQKEIVPNEITEQQAKKWNHLQGLILTKGGIRFRPDKLGWTKKEPMIKGMDERRKKNLKQ